MKAYNYPPSVIANLEREREYFRVVAEDRIEELNKALLRIVELQAGLTELRKALDRYDNCDFDTERDEADSVISAARDILENTP